MRYRVFYRDGYVGDAREWDDAVRWVERALALPPTFHPVAVLPDPLGAEDGEELTLAVGRALAWVRS